MQFARHTFYFYAIASIKQLFPLKHFLRSLGVILVLLIPFFSHAGDTTRLNIEKITAVLSPGRFIDHSGKMSASEALQQNFQSFSPGHNGIGPVNGAAWFSFMVQNPTRQSEWVLEIDAPILHTITVYRLNKGAPQEVAAINVARNYYSKPVKTNRIQIPLEINASDYAKILVKATSNNIIRVPLEIGTFQKFYERNHRFDFVNGWIYGLMFALMLYNLFVFFSLRDKTYFFYVGYIFFWGLNLLFVNGYLLDFMPKLAWFNSANIVIGLTAVFSTLFTTSFLQTKKYSPRVYRLRSVNYFLFIVPVVFNLAGFEFGGYVWAQWCFYPFFIYWIWAGISTYRNGLQPAIYFIWGYSILSIGATIYNFKDIGILPENIFTNYAIQVGSVLEALILSYALANKLHFYKTINDQLRESALRQSENFSKSLLQAQETEKKRIASELHDSLGQKLILIKNNVLLLQMEEGMKENEIVRKLPKTVAETIEEVRSIAYGLRPYQIDLLGLTQSIKSLITESFSIRRIRFEMDIDPINQLLASEHEIYVYRILQECLNNVIKHADATYCRVSVKNVGKLQIVVEDNGKGIDATGSMRVEGQGLRGIEERVRITGGSFVIENKESDKGTIIKITIPFADGKYQGIDRG